LFVQEQHQSYPLTCHLSLTPAERRPSTTDEWLNYRRPPRCIVWSVGWSVEARRRQ